MQPAGAGHHFRYDVFLSFDTNNESQVRDVQKQMKAAGLRTFFAPDDLRPDLGRPDWQKSIFDALHDSAHLAVYCSADALTSSFVREEIAQFRRYVGDTPAVSGERRILLLPGANLEEAELKKRLDSDPFLKGLLRPQSVMAAVLWLTDRQIAALREELEGAYAELRRAEQLARQSFEYYRHARFWKPFSKSQQLYMFTCGRDTGEDAVRGRGGRTNIDKWDYQASVDIIHHFALRYRSIGVEIEHPFSKVRLDEKRLHDSYDISRRLAGRNCVIIGSPDVSDFAEVALARLLNVHPYSQDEPLRTGFRIIKDGQKYSTFYEPTSGTAGEGIHLIGLDGEEMFVCGHERSYGVMVLADNPFPSIGTAEPDKILILAGHTGVSTRAMSLLLTEEEPWCLDVFYELDQALAVMEGPVAAVIEVNYTRTSRQDPVGDDREIPREPGRIRFRSAVQLRPR